jgi:hypothetical protein
VAMRIGIVLPQETALVAFPVRRAL